METAMHLSCHLVLLLRTEELEEKLLAKVAVADQNPRGHDGQPLKCSKCGSTEHLAKRCSKPDNQGQQQMAMLTGIGGSNLQFLARGVSHQSDAASLASPDASASSCVHVHAHANR